MNWDFISTAAEVVGAIAVIVTLIYLARQIRQFNQQQHITAFQHMQDQMNGYLQQVAGSEDVARLLTRGRKSYQELDDAERLRFEYLNFQVLNLVESHLTQSRQTALEARYRDWVIANLEQIVQGQLGFPGSIEFWRSAEAYFDEDVRQLVNRALSSNGTTA